MEDDNSQFAAMDEDKDTMNNKDTKGRGSNFKNNREKAREAGRKGGSK